MKRYALAATAIAVCCFGATACSDKGDGDGNGGAWAQPLDAPTAGAVVSDDPSGGGTGKGDPSGGGCTKPPAACFTMEAGLCCTDPNAKDLAAQLCAAKGATIAGLSIDPKGGCQVTCCEPTPPPPPVEVCTWAAVGDGTCCISSVDLKTKGAAICAAQGGELRSLYPAGDCADGATIAKVECCSPYPANDPKDPGPPPPPK
jgi:hypothetical protein